MEPPTEASPIHLKREDYSRTLKSPKNVNPMRREKRLKSQTTTTIFLIMLMFALTVNSNIVFSQETPLVYVDPPTVTGLPPSSEFTIEVKIANVTEFYGFDLQLRWDPAVLDYVSHIAKIPVETFPDGVLHQTILTIKNEANSTAGTYWLSASSMFPAPSFNGSGTVFEITFHVKAIGQCLLEIYSHELARVDASAIPHNVEHGFFSNYVPTPASISVNPDKIINADLIPCNNFTIDVDLEGVVDLENLEFWLTYNTTVLDLVNVTANPALQPSAIIEIRELEGRMKLNTTTSPPITGDFTLATFTFHVADTGESILDLYNITLVDSWGDPIPYGEPTDSYFSNILKARLFVDPDEIIDPTLIPGSQFSIDIKIESAIDLYGYTFTLSYDTSILTCLGAVIFPPTNDTNFTTEIKVEDSSGYVTINVTYYSPAEPITILSPTTIIKIYYQVQNFGCTDLDLNNTILIDQYGALIPHDVDDGFFCTLTADVAITFVEPSPNMTYSGRIVNITVIAASIGDLPATFNVTVYYDNNTIGTQPVIDLYPNVNITLLFMWNTTGLESCTSYNISAEATPVLYELDLTNNNASGGLVKIKMIGDINGDGQVDIFDIVLAADAYGTVPGDPLWNPDADVAPVFGKVDIFDMVTVGSRYGESC